MLEPPAGPVEWKWPPSNVMLIPSVQCAEGEVRKLDVVFADATVKAPRFVNGAELHGVTAGWRLPEPTKRETVTGVWLLAEPLTLAAGESLVVIVSGETLPKFRMSTSRLGARDPLEVASAATLAALTAPQRTPAQETLLADTWLMSTADEPAAFARYHQLVTKLNDTYRGKAWSMITEATEPIAVRVLPRGNWQDESGPVVSPATPRARRKNGSPDSIWLGGLCPRKIPSRRARSPIGSGRFILATPSVRRWTIWVRKENYPRIPSCSTGSPVNSAAAVGTCGT
jgi:hypothetical protein